MSAAESLGWITLRKLATDVLGSTAKNPGRAGRDWCEARGVPYRRDGKVNWVRVEDVKRAIEGREAANEHGCTEAVDAAVAKLQRAG